MMNKIPAPEPELLVEFYVATNQTWADYKKKFNKNFTVAEEPERRLTWEKNIEKVNLHNQLYIAGNHSFTMGVNQFTDGTVPGRGRWTPTFSVDFYAINNNTWSEYKQKFNKNYSTAEEPLRRLAWEKNVEKINLHNSGYKVGNHSFTMGINQFTDETKPAKGLMMIMNPDYIKYVASNETWELYKVEYNKNYSIAEEPGKRANWEASVVSVNKHNEEFSKGVHTSTQGINGFSDGTQPAKGLLRPAPGLLLAQSTPGHLQPAKVRIEVYEASDKTWEDYKKQWNKTYAPTEEGERRKNWENSVTSVNKHNEEYARGVHTWWQGVNKFSDGTVPGKGLLRPAPDVLPVPTSVKLDVLKEATVTSGDLYAADDESWIKYKLKFNKVYTKEEEPLK